jgi:hypothetical protein
MVVGDAVNFQAQGLWEAIDPGDCDEREDRLTLAALLRSIPNDMWSTLARNKTEREAWEAVKTICVGVQRVRAKCPTVVPRVRRHRVQRW